MSKAEIIAELPRLNPEERAEIQARLDELAGSDWQDAGKLSDEDRQTLDASLAEYQKSTGAGSSWDEAKTRVRSKLQP